MVTFGCVIYGLSSFGLVLFCRPLLQKKRQPFVMNLYLGMSNAVFVKRINVTCTSINVMVTDNLLHCVLLIKLLETSSFPLWLFDHITFIQWPHSRTGFTHKTLVPLPRNKIPECVIHCLKTPMTTINSLTPPQVSHKEAGLVGQIQGNQIDTAKLYI